MKSRLKSASSLCCTCKGHDSLDPVLEDLAAFGADLSAHQVQGLDVVGSFPDGDDLCVPGVLLHGELTAETHPAHHLDGVPDQVISKVGEIGLDQWGEKIHLKSGRFALGLVRVVVVNVDLVEEFPDDGPHGLGALL